MSFSLIPPTAVTRPRRDISPCVTCHISYAGQRFFSLSYRHTHRMKGWRGKMVIFCMV